MKEQTSNQHMMFKGSRVDAIYTEQVLKEYKNNPIIEALPPILTKLEVINKLSMFPDYNDEERKLEDHYRYHCIQKIFNYFEPLKKHIDIEQRLSRIIRQGYLAKNPMGPEYAAMLCSGHNMIRCGDYELSNVGDFKTTAAGFTIIGISGIGKTTTIERVLSLYPQVIRHSKYKGQNLNLYQIPWLKLDCPFDGSLKGLCISFFESVDELLGTDYFKKYGSGRLTVDHMIPRMAHIANLHCIGVLIIDEIQHLSLAKSGGSDKMLNFFVTLVNKIGIPVVLIGTTDALPILQGKFRQARRGSGQGDLLWDRMKNDTEWRLLINGMWPLQWTKKESDLTDEIIDTIYDESQGIIDIAIKLYALSQVKAIAVGREQITAKLIRDVAKESLKLVRPMLEALRSGNRNEILKYSDIAPLDFDFAGYVNNIVSSSSVSTTKRDINDKEIIADYAVIKLVELGIEPKLAEKVVIEIMEDSKSLDKLYIIKESMRIALEREKANTGNNKYNDKKPDFNDLRSIVDEGKKRNVSAYEALKEAGYIKDPICEFISEDDANVEFFPQSISG